MQAFRSRPMILGLIGVWFAFTGAASWAAHGVFAMRGVHAAIVHAAMAHDRDAAHRMTLYADAFRLVQMLLGAAAVGLGCTAYLITDGSRAANTAAGFAFVLGGLVLLLSMFLV